MSAAGFLDVIGGRFQIVEEVSSWQEAVRLAGAMLVRDGVVEPRYVDKMIEVTKELGPYAVIAPGVAMPHARPSDGALGLGAALLLVRRSVNFGSHNDPVYVVIAFATPDKEAHLQFLQELASLLAKADELVKQLAVCDSERELADSIRDFIRLGSVE
ncbi:PTS sugar transporter subunit IIA [Coprothermobacteraceae bacterium]|nr:PTS sugar transporter subunit IIA [Coprothermobacteraceae bacterium]